jgi:hypothetical protein
MEYTQDIISFGEYVFTFKKQIDYYIVICESSDFSKFSGTDWGNIKATKSINLPSDVINSNTIITEQNKNTNVLNYRFGMEYQLTKNNLISLQYDGDYNKLDLNTSSISRQERLNNNIDVSALKDRKSVV